MPHVKNLRNYSGYFYTIDPFFSDENFLTKLNNRTSGIAGPILVDGAKRDQTVWAGDMGVSLPTGFVSTNDLFPARNSLSTSLSLQDPTTGALPFAGPPVYGYVSDTYHAWTLLGAYNYYLYSGDITWLRTSWNNYTKAVAYLANKVDSSGLLDVTGIEDWGRLWQGDYNSEANAIYYKASSWLLHVVELAGYMNDSSLAATYANNASALKAMFNEKFWLSSAGMYRNNLTSTMCPQDANLFAVLFSLTTSAEQASSVSEGLTKKWGAYGSVSPELPETVAPFIGSFEIQAHFLSGNDARAMELLHLEWGYMLYTPLSVQSTLLEGYTSNGSLYYRSYDGYNYDPSYTSHSHGWSTGPTYAFTFYVLGLTLTSPMGQTWSVAPHTSGLSFAQGGFETPLGWFGVEWKSTGNSFTIARTMPEGTSGVVVLPITGTITLDGNAVQQTGMLSIDGGNHTVSVQE
ncbi:uncharacterized protein FIBRA_03033 [Fibroporia radiculosa]|uniref:Alpha-L-rhamnosidase six-hairpin glycosidase domain-containing protein n=1 Tax=Fibroporia radiculosa TaxID=599839 RepID=J4GN92_9APHY|nr:uncharacterized protein FIBRA_03033 [Fibroporia radiculosa]CCM00985.1 predicted protein [Fibroporia radiculosa]